MAVGPRASSLPKEPNNPTHRHGGPSRVVKTPSPSSTSTPSPHSLRFRTAAPVTAHPRSRGRGEARHRCRDADPYAPPPHRRSAHPAVDPHSPTPRLDRSAAACPAPLGGEA
ncbi:hypothetical protein PVAP13_3NG175255 [Panicum virgatum]|uniref:Uncharacterized protein n=1 Tax=Panicum virgatum TaxID=38727 RepID=A0A8T0UH04_PANVG|nr:hypothetical protein PVAP13_3NG175255 [Panicum virgatum]